MNQTPEQILEEVKTTNPNEACIKALNYLLKNREKIEEIEEEEVSYHFKAWNIAYNIEGSILFRFTGNGPNNRLNSKDSFGCGCLTQVKYYGMDSYNNIIRDAIILDTRIVEIYKNTQLTEEQIFAFAQWQTWLDINIPNREDG